MSLSPGLTSSDSSEWETPQELFEELDQEFHFTLDPCSTDDNAKCKKHYTINEDGLMQDWTDEVVFCNPPYGRKIAAWVAKSYMEAEHATVVLLIPARTDTSYFHRFIYHEADEIRFIRGRLTFTQGKRKTKYNAPFPSMVVIYRDRRTKPEESEAKDQCAMMTKISEQLERLLALAQ